MAEVPTSTVRTLPTPTAGTPAGVHAVASAPRPGEGKVIVEVPSPLQAALASDPVARGIRENNSRLMACGGHRFVPRTYDQATGKVVVEYSCSECGGVVTTDQAYWYNSGSRHGLIDSEIDRIIRLLRSADQNQFSKNITLKLQRIRDEMKQGQV